MGNVKFSIIAPAIRENLYKRFYDSLAGSRGVRDRSQTSFEIIFVGFSPPKEQMSSNFGYIYTKVNAVQCWEIAAREAQGEYLILAVDDCLFSRRFLDRIYYYLNRLYMENTLIGTRYQTNGVFYDKILTYSGRIQNAPVLPSTCAFKREVWTELGGLDRRFPGAFCNADMILRFYERGYNLFIAPDCWLNEIRNNEVQSSWWKKTGKRGQMICNTFGLRMV